MSETRDINGRSRGHDDNATKKRSVLVFLLWTTQVILAVLFLFAGSSKLVLSAEAMKGPIEFPLLFLRFIGVAEALGALGLILPGLLRIKPGLTPLAALGLTIIMVGATVLNFVSVGAPLAAFTFAVGCLTGFVAYGRWRLAPHKARPGSHEDSKKDDYAFKSISNES